VTDRNFKIAQQDSMCLRTADEKRLRHQPRRGRASVQGLGLRVKDSRRETGAWIEEEGRGSVCSIETRGTSR